MVFWLLSGVSLSQRQQARTGDQRSLAACPWPVRKNGLTAVMAAQAGAGRGVCGDCCYRMFIT